MRVFAIGLLLYAAQLNNSQPQTVVHLQPHKDAIEARFDGSLVELINAPQIVHLPVKPPKPDQQGLQWAVAVKNLGPSVVTITNDITHFETEIRVGQTIRIKSTGFEYRLLH